MGTSDELTATIADRLAVTDVLVRYLELVDIKGWDQMHEVFTEDTAVRWTETIVMQGRDALVSGLQAMVGSAEVSTFHHIGAVKPAIDGDTATADVRVRAMHYGVGPRAGKYYESLGVQPTELVRTSQGWRISHHEWQIKFTNGDFDDLFAPELAARAAAAAEGG